MISQEKLQKIEHFNSLDHIQKQMVLKKANREKISLGLKMSELKGFEFWVENRSPSERVRNIVQELIDNETDGRISEDL